MKGFKGRNYDKEHELLDRLKHENKKLKSEVKRLRKELDKNRIDYETLNDLIELQNEEEFVKKEDKDTLKKKWQCHKCQEGYLRLIILRRPDGPHYIRKCNNCPNKTKIKKYTDKVEGIVE